MKSNRRIQVIGKVQGVFFRKSTREKALELHIKGWVRNETDGSVLTEIEGNPKQLSLMEDWLKKGPERAKVERLIVNEGEEIGYKNFEIIQ